MSAAGAMHVTSVGGLEALLVSVLSLAVTRSDTLSFTLVVGEYSHWHHS